MLSEFVGQSNKNHLSWLIMLVSSILLTVCPAACLALYMAYAVVRSCTSNGYQLLETVKVEVPGRRVVVPAASFWLKVCGHLLIIVFLSVNALRLFYLSPETYRWVSSALQALCWVWSHHLHTRLGANFYYANRQLPVRT